MKKIGYIYSFKKNGLVKKQYSFIELLFDPTIKKEFNNTANSFICSCNHNCNIKLTDDNNFYTLGIHSDSCQNYLSLINRIINYKSIRPFVNQIYPLPVRFRWCKGNRSSSEFINHLTIMGIRSDSLSLSEFISLINTTTFFKLINTSFEFDLKRFIYQIYFEIGRLKLIDPDGNSLQLIGETLSLKSGISFFYGKIISINSTYKTKYYLSCWSHTGTISLSIEKKRFNLIEPYTSINLPIWIACIVSIREVSGFQHGGYDSKTHTSYGSKSKRIERSIKSFTLFHANNLGLLCFTKDEKELTETLFLQKKKFYKPWLPQPDNTFPELIIPMEDSNDISYKLEDPL